MAWRKLGIVASGGELPVALAEHCAATGQQYFVARVSPFADEAAFANHPGASHGLGAMGARAEALKQAGCDALVFVGRVMRPDLSTLQFDDAAMQMLPSLIPALGKGDDALLRALLDEHVKLGFQIVGADEVMRDITAPAGVLGAHAPDDNARKEIALAAKVVAAIGALDIGQAAVVCDKLVLGVEAQEGTDALLARILELPPHVRGSAEKRRGVLLKRPKPLQERKIDLPVIGVRTIDGASRAGLAGIAVEAGSALLIRREALIAAADAAGLFVYGFTRAEIGEA